MKLNLLLALFLGASLAVLGALVFTYYDDTGYPATPFDVTPGVDGIVYHWSSPIGGADVVQYLVMVEKNEYVSKIITPFAVVVVPYSRGDFIRVRVAGLNKDGKQGPWSEWSDMYMVPRYQQREDAYDGNT